MHIHTSVLLCLGTWVLRTYICMYVSRSICRWGGHWYSTNFLLLNLPLSIMLLVKQSWINLVLKLDWTTSEKSYPAFLSLNHKRRKIGTARGRSLHANVLDIVLWEKRWLASNLKKKKHEKMLIQKLAGCLKFCAQLRFCRV
jgi:hypothetical protein